MLRLDVYAVSTLQDTASILRIALDAGMSMQDVVAVIDQRINELAIITTSVASTVEPVMRQCPSCGRGLLAMVANSDGLRIVGCRICRYSRIEGA